MANSRKYITGIDGLRTIAVIFVILYHLFPNIIKGGYLGVTLFFVISGYLMTDILYGQWEKNQKIKLGLFYKRRISRLAPSLIIMLVVCGAVLLFFPHQFLNQYRGVVLSSLLYYNNWWQILHGVSYFVQFGQAMPFVHLWSLSVEGQFYLLWPIILGVLFFLKVKPKNLLLGITGLSIISEIEMALLYNPNNLNRVYYGTDTRLFSLMLGCLLAVILREYSNVVPKLSKKVSIIAGIVSLMIIIPIMCYLPDNNPFVYRGGMYIFSILSMVLLGLVIAYQPFNQLLTNKFFKWCGSRSYEIYLWQYPVLVVYSTIFKLNGSHLLLNGLIQLAIIILLSELTYRLVQYYRQGWPKFKESYYIIKTKKQKINAIIVSLVTVLFIISLVVAPNGKTETTKQLEQALTKKEKQINKKPKKPKNSEKQTEYENQLVADSQNTPVPLTIKEVQKVESLKVTAIGDSVLLDAAPDIQKYIPDTHFDAEVGRQLKDSISLIKDKKKNGELAKTVIIALGTNGSFEQKDLDEILDVLKGHKVYLINTVVPKVWQQDVNEQLAKAAKKYKNVYLIDWYGLAKGQSSWFYNDGTHMNENGSMIYANNLVKQMSETIK